MLRGEKEGGKTEEKVSMSAIFQREYLSVVLLFSAFSFALSTGQSVVGTMLPIFLKN